MNPYLTDALARERQADLIGEAAASRTARRLRSEKVARRHASGARRSHGIRAFGHPVSALQDWLASGQL